MKSHSLLFFGFIYICFPSIALRQCGKCHFYQNHIPFSLFPVSVLVNEEVACLIFLLQEPWPQYHTGQQTASQCAHQTCVALYYPAVPCSVSVLLCATLLLNVCIAFFFTYTVLSLYINLSPISLSSYTV